MNYFYLFGLFLAVFAYVLSTKNIFDTPESLLVSCNLGDMECLRQSTELFLEQTHKGISSHDILAIDPLLIPALDVTLDSEGLLYENKHITVKGLRHQKIHEFEMDVTMGSVVLTTSADLTIVGDITVSFTKLSKSMTGHYSSNGSVLGTAVYSYELTTDETGVEHFDVSPETISCQVVDGPTFQFNPELEHALISDFDTEAFCPKKINELWQDNFCKIVEKAYKNVIHNIRAAARVLPASAFFKNLHD